MALINELKHHTLTRAVNRIKSPNRFLQKLLYSNHRTVPTEDIDISIINREREIAPFIRKNGEAVMVSGWTSTNQSVSPPNIRIKRPFQASELLYGRMPGSVIYTQTAGQAISEVQKHIALDLQVLSDIATNATEWLCALALQGTITYSVADNEVFTITYPKPSANNITLSTFWNDATPANVTVEADLHTVKRVLSDAVGLGVTDAICGREAATAFLNLVASGNVTVLNRNDITAGTVTFNTQFNEDGVIFLGTFMGIRFWEYGRTASLNGTATSMIRTKYVEFVSTSQSSERVLYFGAIADMAALQGSRFQTERFSKAWEQQDPSVMNSLLASRPLPVPRKPDATVSVKVVSG